MRATKESGISTNWLRRAGHTTAGGVRHTVAARLSGYLKAFAEAPRDLAEQITARFETRDPCPTYLPVPRVGGGVRGKRFVGAGAVVASRRADATRTPAADESLL